MNSAFRTRMRISGSSRHWPSNTASAPRSHVETGGRDTRWHRSKPSALLWAAELIRIRPSLSTRVDPPGSSFSISPSNVAIPPQVTSAAFSIILRGDSINGLQNGRDPTLERLNLLGHEILDGIPDR